MAKWYRQRIGYINILLMSVVSGLVAFLSILSLAGEEQAKEWYEHPYAFFFSRLGMLMGVALVLIAALAGLNIVYNLIYSLQTPRNWYTNVVPVVAWTMLACILFSIIGTLVLLS